MLKNFIIFLSVLLFLGTGLWLLEEFLSAKKLPEKYRMEDSDFNNVHVDFHRWKEKFQDFILMWNLLSVCTIFLFFIFTKNIKLLLLVNHAPTISEMALGWDFLGIPNPQWMGIFHFGLHQKSRRWGQGICDPQKSPVKNSQKIPNLGDFLAGNWGFLSPGFFGYDSLI